MSFCCRVSSRSSRAVLAPPVAGRARRYMMMMVVQHCQQGQGWALQQPAAGRHCQNFLAVVSPMVSSLSRLSVTQSCIVRQFATHLDNPKKRAVTHSLVRQFATHSDKKRAEAGTVNIPFWGRLLIVSGVAGVVYYLFHTSAQIKDLESEEYRYKEFKKIQLGGDWTLTDHHGNKRSSKDFRGQWIVMYMGFSHCPDICPEEMEKLGEVVLNFDTDPKLPNLQPVFITLDPERDTPAVIKDYLRDFKSPRIVGFTGSDDEIREVAKTFRAYYGKGERDADNDYIVDHTIIIYLINPMGEFVNYYDRSLTAQQVTESIKKHVQKYQQLESLRK